jgi:hypothetical protein
MIAPRFDQATKTIAKSGLSRRSALRALTGTGVAAALSTGVGQGQRNVAAQSPRLCCIYTTFGELSSVSSDEAVAARICPSSGPCPNLVGNVTEVSVDDCSACPAYP